MVRPVIICACGHHVASHERGVGRCMGRFLTLSDTPGHPCFCTYPRHPQPAVETSRSL